MPESSTCYKTGLSIPPSKTYKSNSILYTGVGRLPVSKNALNEIFKYYREKYGNSRTAMQRVCMAFDLYYDDTIFIGSKTEDGVSMGNYMRTLSMNQYRDKTFDDNIDEGFQISLDGKDVLPDERNPDPEVEPKLLKKWGRGFDYDDYQVLDEHFKYLKSSNPNCDSNQQIFITDLCYTKMQQMKAVREGRVDDYNKLTESYRKSFSQAKLKTGQDLEKTSGDTWGTWIEKISQYAPEEIYKDKTLYNDFDGRGEYYDRFVLRPMRNLMTGSTDRDTEYFIEDDDDG